MIHLIIKKPDDPSGEATVTAFLEPERDMTPARVLEYTKQISRADAEALCDDLESWLRCV